MEPLVNAKDLDLFWVQPSATRHYFILRSGETIFARLNFQSEFDALAEATSINDAWTINRVGFFSPHIIVHRVGSNIDRATSSPSWTGAESQIQFSSGEVYFWKVANFWATRHTISNGDWKELVAYHSGSDEKKFSNLFKRQAQVLIALDAWGLVELPLIVSLGWYLVLLQQEDSAAVAAMGAMG